MKHLFNYCAIDWYEDELKKLHTTLAELVQRLGVDGVEQLIYQVEPAKYSYKDLTVGVHLNYWPYWMDFWTKNVKRLRQQFPGVRERTEYFKQAMSTDEWLAVIRRNINVALAENPQYLVWHVGEATNYDAFTWDFHYKDKEVLGAAADVFNSVADEIPQHVTVLFENLWWPGLRLTNVRNVKYFFDHIKRENVGIMLDTGHLMNTNPNLRSEAEGADYVCHTVGKLGALADLIKGVHLNCSLSGAYQRSFKRELPKNLTRKQIWEHINAIDQHKPFTTQAAKQILDCVQPDFVNHELYYESLPEMQEKVALQLSQLR